MFQHIRDARLLTKFDLKSGFWQLELHPANRPKIGFSIPNHHFQWTVLPFRLKTAPSLFQQAMIQIFQPILPNTLIYIDDLLLFSSTPEEHHQLLHQFATIIDHHGIMLSQAKMEIRKREIDFVGTHLQDGTYTLQPHISTALQRFPDHLSSPKMIQQFLGFVNYMADFIPYIAKHRAILSPLLSKKPPPWSSQHLKEVQALKTHSKHLPPLHIPSHSTPRIL